MIDFNFDFFLPKRIPVGTVFTHGPIFRPVSKSHEHIAPISVKFGRKVRSSIAAKFYLDQLRFTAPKTMKISNFTNIIAPEVRVPYTILTKFTGFMRVLSLHKST